MKYFRQLIIIRPSLQKHRSKVHAVRIAFMSYGIPYYMNAICTACKLFLSFCTYGLMMVNWPKRLQDKNKIKIYCCVWLKPENILLSFGLVLLSECSCNTNRTTWKVQRGGCVQFNVWCSTMQPRRYKYVDHRRIYYLTSSTRFNLLGHLRRYGLLLQEGKIISWSFSTHSKLH
jgi:hypothetical protein